MQNIANFTLERIANKLSLIDNSNESIKPIYIDFADKKLQYRVKNSHNINQLIAKAVGIKSGFRPSVLDINAGMAKDAFMLASLGCRVHMLERNFFVSSLIKDALLRASQNQELLPTINLLSFEEYDAKLWLKDNSEKFFEVVYIDPMFPKREKSSKVKKEMAVFQNLVGADDDSYLLLDLSFKTATKRVVVKRSKLAGYLNDKKPDIEYKGKSCRFDVYLKSYCS